MRSASCYALAFFLNPFGLKLVVFASPGVSVFGVHGSLGVPPGSILVVSAPFPDTFQNFLESFAVGSLV